jgi:hypothetical protein
VFHARFTQTIARFALSGLLAIGSIAGVVAATPAASAHGAQVHVVKISAHDNGLDNKAFRGWFTMPSKVPTGLVEYIFENDGSTGHMAQLFKLNPGVSEDKFLGRLAPLFTTRDPAKVKVALHELLEVAAAAGGTESIMAGKQQDVIERVSAGHYMVVCFDTTSDGTAHFLLGMHKGFWASSDVSAPVDTGHVVNDGSIGSNGTITESDHSITVPSAIHQDRPLVLKITVADQTHEFALLKVPAGTTKAQLLQCLTGPQSSCTLQSPPVDAGGAGALAPGGTHWIELHLAPGTYAALCFVPDINTGMPHAFMGMITVFTVHA